MEISSKWISTSQFSSYILPSLNDVIVKVLRIDKSEIKPLSVISFFEKASYWCSHRTPRKNRRDFIFCQTQYYYTQRNWNVLAPLYRYSSIGYSISHNLCLFLNFWSQYNSVILLLLSCEEYSKTYWSNPQNASAKQCWHIFMEWLLLLIPYNLFQFHEKFNKNKNLLLGIAALHQRLVQR